MSIEWIGTKFKKMLDMLLQISELLASIYGEDDATFIKELISYDSTNMNTKAVGVEMADIVGANLLQNAHEAFIKNQICVIS